MSAAFGGPGMAAKPLALHVVTALNFGGVERQMQTVAECAAISDFDHGFLALGGGGTAEAAIRQACAPVWCLNLPTSVYSPSALVGAYRKIRAIAPAVLHAHGAEANFLGVLAGRFARVPTIFAEEIGLPSHSWKARLAFRGVYRLVDGLVAVSSAVRDRVLRMGEARDGQVTVIENPISVHSVPRKVARADSAGVRFVFVGRLVRQKAVDVLLEALAKMGSAADGVELWIIGEGPEEVVLQQRAQALRLSVRFLGYQADPEGFLLDCDVFVFPSRGGEGFSLALGEALAMGLPAIATDIAGAPDVVKDGISGWLVPPENVGALAAALVVAASTSPSRRSEMGKAGRHLVRTSHSPEAYIKKLDALYSSTKVD